MHIPARYYKRIPSFYFIVGILLVITSFNMDENPLGSSLYLIAGVVSVIYAVSVYYARRKRRKNARSPVDLRPTPEDPPPATNKRPPLINDNPAPAAAQQAQADEKESGTEERDLPQHGGGVPAPAQPEVKS